MRHRSSVLPLMRMSGFGRARRAGSSAARRRVHSAKHRPLHGRTRHGGRKMMMIQGSGRRRRMHGMGFFDTLKNLGSKALGIARSIPIVSTGLKLAGQDKYADMAKSIGLGRRRRVRRTHRYGGRMSVYGGRRVRRHRTRRYGGRRVRRPTKRRFSLFGGRRHIRRYRRKRVGGRKRRPMRGGFLGSLLSGLLGGRRARRAYGVKRHVRRHRRVGGRKRTYRIGLFNRRR